MIMQHHKQRKKLADGNNAKEIENHGQEESKVGSLAD